MITKRTTWAMVAVLICFAIALPVSSQMSMYQLKGDAEAGKGKTTVCVACHLEDGNSQNPLWPKLAGQGRKFLFKQLQNYKKGKEGGIENSTMNPMTATLSEEDMWDLSAYFASQKATIGETNRELFALGQQIYRGGNLETHVSACIACHGPKGKGNPLAAFPHLSGQHAAYVEQALRDYQKGVRINGTANIMHMISKRMTDDEIKAVASYIEGLH